MGPRSLTRQSQSQKEAETKLFMRKPGNAPITAFEKKLMAAREGRTTPGQEPQTHLSPDASRKTTDSLENIRQWQRHYRKAFPTYVFYFESLPDETRQKMSRLVQSLGAREEKFFSRTVTHVVTTRPIPAAKSHADNDAAPNFPDLNKHNPQQRTIDPALLDRRDGSHLNGAMRRTTDLLDATLQAKSGMNAGYGYVQPAAVQLTT